MASLAIEKKSGRKRIQFFLNDQRLSIDLGKLTAKQAQTVHAHVKHLIAAKITGTTPDNHTSQWVASIDNKLHAKLAARGLVLNREAKPSETIAAWTQSYIESRTDLKPATKTNLGYAAKFLCEFLGSDKPLIDVSDRTSALRRLAI